MQTANGLSNFQRVLGSCPLRSGTDRGPIPRTLSYLLEFDSQLFREVVTKTGSIRCLRSLLLHLGHRIFSLSWSSIDMCALKW